MKKVATFLGGLSFLALYSCGGSGGLAEPDVHYRDFGVNVAVRSSPYLTPENHKDGWKKRDCLLCHQNFKHTMATPRYSKKAYQGLIDRAVSKVGTENAIRVCSACHGTNGVAGVKRSCLVCHDSMDKLHFYANTSLRKQSFHDFNGNGKIDDLDCVVCHWQPDMDGIVEPGTDFGALGGIQPQKVQDLCLTCHSPTGANIFNKPVADTNGDGKADKVLTPKETPPDIETPWNNNDWHGENNFTSGNRSFKEITLSGELLFHTAHSPLACTQCHNPHASNNDKLIIERVGETLEKEMIVKQVDNTAEVKYAVVDPQTLLYFKDLKFEGIVKSENGTYDLSNATQLKEYLYLPVKNLDGVDVATNRKYTSSLCAACHSGNYYSPVNGLSLPIDIKNHGNPNSKCVECHIHGKTF